MLQSDLDKLYRYQKQLDAVRFRPTLIMDNKNDAESISIIFGFIMIPYFFVSKDLILDSISKDINYLFFYGFWLFLSIFSLFIFFKNLKQHINGVKKYKSSGIDHFKIDEILKKYDRKLTNKNFSYTAFGQNYARTLQLISYLEEAKKINSINKVNKKAIIVS